METLLVVRHVLANANKVNIIDQQRFSQIQIHTMSVLSLLTSSPATKAPSLRLSALSPRNNMSRLIGDVLFARPE